jgi:hypothetical protein
MIIAIDFDGTCVDHQYPYVGSPLLVQWKRCGRWPAGGTV